MPDLDCEEAIVSSEAGIGHATDFVARTTFEAPPPPFTRPSLERQWSDDDGAYLRQTRRVTDDVNLADCILAQRQIPRGARVCVFGQYSESRRAIVANPNDWSKTTRVMTGDAEAIVPRLRSRAIGRLIGGLVALALAAAAVMALMPQRANSRRIDERAHEAEARPDC